MCLLVWLVNSNLAEKITEMTGKHGTIWKGGVRKWSWWLCRPCRWPHSSPELSMEQGKSGRHGRLCTGLRRVIKVAAPPPSSMLQRRPPWRAEDFTQTPRTGLPVLQGGVREPPLYYFSNDQWGAGTADGWKKSTGQRRQTIQKGLHGIPLRT